MIDEKKLEEVAFLLSDRSYEFGDEAEACKLGFIAGAQWAQKEFVNSLWHNASEEPLVDKPILIEYIVGNKKKYTFSSNRPSSWEDYVSKFNWSKYCYIEDILLEQKGDEK